jgi:hypothetical protein
MSLDPFKCDSDYDDYLDDQDHTPPAQEPDMALEPGLVYSPDDHCLTLDMDIFQGGVLRRGPDSMGDFMEIGSMFRRHWTTLLSLDNRKLTFKRKG